MQLRMSSRYGLQGELELTRLEGVGAVREFAVGLHGRLYLLDERGDLWMYDRGSAHHERVFPQGHELFSPGSRLAVAGDALIVADRDGDRTLAAYQASSGQTLWLRTGGQADGLPLIPLAIAADERAVYALTPLDVDEGGDEPAVPEGGKLAVVRFNQSGGVTGVYTDPAFTLKVRAKLRHLYRTHELAVASNGRVYAFDSLSATLYSFGGDGSLQVRLKLPSLPYAGLCVDTQGSLYIGDSRQLGPEDEDDRFIMRLSPDGSAIDRVTGFRGKADQLATDGRDRLFILGGEDETITTLDLQPQTVELPDTGVPEGAWLSCALDSREADTVWHKIQLDADIPEGTQLTVSYFASDREDALLEGRMRRIDDWITDETISYRDKLTALAPYWSAPAVNPSDALFFGARGRYLWLKLDWIGTERHSPSLERLRVHFPRETYLNDLPAVYQEDEASRDFLERFLSLFGTLFDSVEAGIDDLPRRLDPDLAEGAQLRWLASWIGLETDEHWQDEQVRRFMKAAPELYRYRGTRRGIAKAIETYTGQPPIIVEHFQTRAMREHGEMRELAEQLYGGGDPYTFTVLLRPEQAPTEKHRIMIERLLEDQKPAYTESQLVLLQPWMYLDLHTYLGVNTVLAEPSLFTIDPDRSMPNDTLIVDYGMDRRLDTHTRLGLDSEME